MLKMCLYAESLHELYLLINDDGDRDAHGGDHGDDLHDGRDGGGGHDVRDGHDDGGDRDVHDGHGGGHGDHDDDALHQWVFLRHTGERSSERRGIRLQ
ncbi:hypothetical protein TNIN_329501 [Trichonephila inaurata madagascariensis]|uniref:Uncharacterized protein n=1 Tax=Trichonephila inaurata madagascariensis TaxID=2747483 RepID=A0A8X6Y979_9ARAC|nr:hypothetical protein TNIN_329501 [Trichonephila inaurata madagascariensis]